jgi:hypothetical protein
MTISKSDGNGNPLGHNHLSHAGAVELARRLRRYWLDLGFNIRTDVETLPGKHAQFYGVRSNLVNGLPPADSKVTVPELEAAA